MEKVPKFFRGDAAFASPKLLRHLEQESYWYAIRLKANAVLEPQIALDHVPPDIAARLADPSVLVRVAHVTPLTGGYLVGGSFVTPLTYQEMSALVL